MIEILFFSLSISIDAFGYSFGFGMKNIHISKKDFFVLNLLNVLILCFSLVLLNNRQFSIGYLTFQNLSNITLALLGSLYIGKSFYVLLKGSNQKKENNIAFKSQKNYFSLVDFLAILAIFVFENMFSSLVFYSKFNNVVLFVFSNFIFHYLFFVFGFDFGKKLLTKINIDTSFFSGMIFVCLSLSNLL